MRTLFASRLGTFTATVALMAIWQSSAALAAGSPATTSEFDYPELLVTPRASERVATEAGNESSTRWLTLAPIQVSSVATLISGISLLASPDRSKDPDGVAGFAGISVGGVWLASTLALQLLYHPYSSAQQDLANMPAKTPREQLVRERFAEEAVKSAASLEWRLRWLSFLTNLGASGYMLAKSESSSFQMVASGVSMAFSLAPIIFCGRWHQVAAEQESYKKRIFAPIASATIFSEPGTGNPAPGGFLTMSF